jgi:hypothetical protein
MPTRLLACPSCARHVRVSEVHCPFCGADCSAPVGCGPPRAPSGRVTRLGLLAYGTAGALAVAACSGGEARPGPLYGAPPCDAGPSPWCPDSGPVDTGLDSEAGATGETESEAPGGDGESASGMDASDDGG